MLPEGGIPDVLRSTTQHSDDLLSLEQERAGYVVQDDDDDDDDDDEIIYYGEDEVKFLLMLLPMQKHDFHQYEEVFRSLQPGDLKLASVEEDQHKTHSNPVVQALKKHISTVQTKVIGTDESWTRIHSFVWGMTVKKGPPSLWITLNPTDTHDPIAQVFTGAKINLDHFDNTAGPDATQHPIRIAQDPYAAAKLSSSPEMWYFWGC
ncbi:hypothetical protein BDN67DRAFT_992389 [Paxillus ammoniavirescens]|nr:hypothetical protein BDN67DRAFT_992389 [Paxillus ammoniavirescens]